MPPPTATPVLPVDPAAPDPAVLARAAEVLRGGGLVAFPTETVYGLGADATDAAAVRRIYAAKGRPARNPLIVHVASADDARRLAAEWPPSARRLAARFWPGPLSVVLARRPGTIPDIVTAGADTIALRVPAHPVALGLVRACGLPLAAPSANPSNALSPTRAEHVVAGLGGRIDLILDGGPTSGGLESTVVDLTTSPPRLLRPGLITLAELQAEIGPIVLLDPGGGAGEDALPAPGMLARHYAPRTPLDLVEGSGRQRVLELARTGRKVGWLRLHQAAPLTGPNLVTRGMPTDPPAYAAELYAALHDLDAAGLDRIVADLPPDTDPWRAVRDRLQRAGRPE